MALPRLVGEFRVGGDPNLRFTPGGTAVADFSVIASSNKQQPDGSWLTIDETGWIRVNVWGASAERVANDVTKGCKVFLVGRYKVRKWTDREQQERTSVEVDADAIEVIPDRRDTPVPAATPAATSGGSDPWGKPTSDPAEPPFLVMPERTPFY